jgi:hypothetical protein
MVISTLGTNYAVEIMPSPHASAFKKYPMRRCEIRVERGIYPPCKLKIRPCTTCLDVLSYLGLTEDYVLTSSDDPTRTFTPDEVLYDLIKNDEKLIAKLSPEAEARYAQLFMQ